MSVQLPQVNIQVDTQYIDAQSEPENEHYVFAYTITISSSVPGRCQLLNRHWVITDASGGTEEVRGEGVVGRQPALQPDESFRYTSGTVLKTPVGSMHGEYEFVTDDGTSFNVQIPAFSLSLPNMVH